MALLIVGNSRAVDLTSRTNPLMKYGCSFDEQQSYAVIQRHLAANRPFYERHFAFRRRPTRHSSQKIHRDDVATNVLLRVDKQTSRIGRQNGHSSRHLEVPPRTRSRLLDYHDTAWLPDDTSVG